MEREIEFTVKGNPYKMKFPNVGQFLQIESKRIILTNDTYSQMLMSRLISAGKAMDMADMVATITVLCPEFINDLKTKSILDLDIIDAKELIELWNTRIKVWVDSWMKLFVESPAAELKPKSDSEKTS